MPLDTKRIYEEQKQRARQHIGNEEALARFVSKRLIASEAALMVTAAYLCEKAGDDRRGEDAQAQATVEGALDLIMAGHRMLSVLAAKRDLLDIPGEGGR